MKVNFADTFWPSFKRMLDSENPLRWSYWTHKWYDLRWAIRNYVRYFRVVAGMRPWDSHSVITMMKFQIDHLSKTMEKSSMEVEETMNPKLDKMNRFVELADHYLEEDYADRCGFDHDYDFTFEPVEGEPNLSQLGSTETKEQAKNNRRAIKEAHELGEKEWEEMIELLKDMRSWWY